MAAELLVRERVILSERAFAELLLWRVPKPVRGSVHDYKYRLALIVEGECVLRFDNEAGKGDHRHLGATESEYCFHDVETLMADFRSAVTRWLDEHRQI